MSKPTAEMLKKGYLLFPKVLFEEQMKAAKGATGSFDAFILVLTHVNYSTTTCCIHNHTFECHRGESVMSLIGRNCSDGNAAVHGISSIRCTKRVLSRE